MNKKQIASMWLGILFFVSLLIMLLIDLSEAFGRLDNWYDELIIYTVLDIIVTTGLIFTFKDRKKELQKRRVNKKQLFCMWLEIIFLVLVWLVYLLDGGYSGSYSSEEILMTYAIISFIGLIITSGLIITFKDKKTKGEQKQ